MVVAAVEFVLGMFRALNSRDHCTSGQCASGQSVPDLVLEFKWPGAEKQSEPLDPPPHFLGREGSGRSSSSEFTGQVCFNVGRRNVGDLQGDFETP